MSDELQWLHAYGSSIVREDGASMLLRGTNLPSLDLAVATTDRYVTYLDTARSMGFNVARLPICWAQLEPSRGRYNTAYENAIAKIASLAERDGMYVVVDMHQDRMSGFPRWVLSKFKGTDQAASGFWTDPALQAELIEAWRTLASRLADEKAIFGYDLLNEPYGGSLSWQDFAPILNDFYAKAISEIRSVDLKHVILFEPVEGTCILGEHIALKPEGGNLVFSPHMYVRGQADYLENIFVRLHELNADTWNIPLWIGEFGGVTVDIYDGESLESLTTMLDLFDRYALGWAYWTLADMGSYQYLVDAHGLASSHLTETIARIFPASYTIKGMFFSYNGTPRFVLEAYALHVGEITVSVPHRLNRMMIRCINCISSSDEQGLSLTISVPTATHVYFYMDVQDTLVKLRARAESAYSQASRTLSELETTDFQSDRGREYAQEIRDLVAQMSVSLAEENYEVVVNGIGRVNDLQASALREEKDYRDTEQFIKSVEQDILASQGRLGTWQSVLLTRAHQSLKEGNYSSAHELAEQARGMPREMPHEVPDSAMLTVLWQTSSGLLIIAASFVVYRSLRARKARVDDRQITDVPSASQQSGRRVQ